MDIQKVRSLVLKIADEVDRYSDGKNRGETDTEKLLREKAGLLANDLNNIVQEIQGYVELLLQQENNPEKARAYLHAIGQAAERATRVSARLEEFSRKAHEGTPRKPAAAPDGPVDHGLNVESPIGDEDLELKKARPIANPEGRHPLVMIVDDEPQICELLELVLTTSGFKVLSAYNGQEALTLYRQYQGEIKLVILDYIMPGPNGVDVYRALKEVDSEVKAFLVSGHQEAQTVHDLLAMGILGFLSKPYSAERLLNRVREAIGVGG